MIILFLEYTYSIISLTSRYYNLINSKEFFVILISV